MDLPIEWVPSLLNVLKDAKIEHDGSLENSTDDGKVLRIIGGVKGWNNKKMLELEPENINLADLENLPGPDFNIDTSIFTNKVLKDGL